MDSAKKVFSDARLDTRDGCRFDFDDGWLHLRASNTEPIMRIIVEAKDEAVAQKYIDAVFNIRRQILG
jgi:phosphomannomutase